MRQTVKFLFGIFALFIFSCQNHGLFLLPDGQEQEPQVVLTKDFQFDQSKKTLALDQLAQLVAYSLQDKEFRAFLKNEAMKQVDGDYDVIYSLTREKSIKGQLDLSSYLQRKAEEYFGKDVDVEKLISQVKDFQMSVPVNCEKWDIENYVPLVTYIPESFDEKTFKFVKAYDSQGQVYSLSTEQAPEYPVVVLGSCERMDYINGKEIDIDPGHGGGSGGGNWSGGNDGGDGNNGNNTGGNNQTYKYFYLKQLGFQNLSAYESWIQGKPEIYGKLYRQGMDMPYGNFYSMPLRREVNGRMKYYNFRMERCFLPQDTIAVFKFWESDSNGADYLPITFSVEYHGVTFSITIKVPMTGKDDDLGNYVYFRDDPKLKRFSDSNFAVDMQIQ